MSKIIIYQVLPRYFGNKMKKNLPHGSLLDNGAGKLKNFSTLALTAIRELGVTHIWYTGIIEHATQTDYSAYGIAKDHPAIVKGKAGSPYAIKDYYDIDPDLAVSVNDRIKEFELLVKRTHRAGLKVIIDFVPNHLARQYASDAAPNEVEPFGKHDKTDGGFYANNNFYYLGGQSFVGDFDLSAGADSPYQEFPAKATGNDCFTSRPSVNDWYETIKLNYGVDYASGGQCYFEPVPDTWEKMHHILSYWTDKGVDGFRCDMAEMVPAAFWNWVIPQLKQQNPELLFIGEVYNPGLYDRYLSAGFDYLYDKVGLYDRLKEVVRGYAPAFSITQCWQHLGPRQAKMLNFLENHDEQRIASPYFAGCAEKALPALVVSACMNTNPFMIYSGQELGETGMYQEGFSGSDGRSSIFDYWCIDSLARWCNDGRFDGGKLSTKEQALRNYYVKVLNVCLNEPTLSEGLFFDLMYVNLNQPYFDASKHYAFLRKQGREMMLIVVNFSDEMAHVRVQIPQHAFDYFQLKTGYVSSIENLLDGEVREVMVEGDGLVPCSVKPYGACLWKYKDLKTM